MSPSTVGEVSLHPPGKHFAVVYIGTEENCKETQYSTKVFDTKYYFLLVKLLTF